MKVKFLKTYTVKAVDGETYEAGKVYELSDESAKHFIDHGRAVSVEKPDKAPKAIKGHPAEGLDDEDDETPAKGKGTHKPDALGHADIKHADPKAKG